VAFTTDISRCHRIFSLGKLEASLEEAYNAACQIEEAVARELVAGKTGRELFELSEAKGERLGYKIFWRAQWQKMRFCGHGVGLSWMSIRCWAPDHEILDNMTIAVEPKMIYPDKASWESKTPI